jgi:hypothetical protein
LGQTIPKRGLRNILIRNKKKDTWPNSDFNIIVCCDGTKILVSPEDFDYLRAFKWSIKKSFYRKYAGRWTTENGKRKFLIMHRVITGCRPDLVVHHVNHNTFDNRRENLLTLTDYEHKEEFSYR